MSSVTDNMEYVVDMLLEDDDEGAMEWLLLEGEERDLLTNLGGETTLMNYLIKFEEYMDDHDIYLFDGWEDAQIVGKPLVEKFWVTVWLRLGPNAQIAGAKRLMNDKEGQNTVKFKKLGVDGRDGYLLKIRVLKRFLDQIEKRNQEKSDQLSDDEIEEI